MDWRLEQRLKLHHLRALNAIRAHRSLLRAAQALRISQPALTKTVQELEALLGLQLFERLPRGVRPTIYGEAMAETAGRVLAEIARLERVLAQLATQAGSALAIGALPTAAAGVLPVVLATFKERYPTVDVQLVQGATEDLLPALASNSVDLVIGRLYEPRTEDAFVREAMYDEPISVLVRAGHPVFALPALTGQDLRPLKLVLPTLSQRISGELDHILDSLGLSAMGALRTSSWAAIRELLLDGDYITLAPRMIMAGDLARGALRVVELPLPTTARPAGVIHRGRASLAPAAAAFIEVLRDHLSRQADVA